jgi:hypothetical protein
MALSLKMLSKTQYEESVHFKEVIKMLPNVQNLTAEISELIYKATRPEENEE